jgi:hypothetical protein
MGNFRSARSVDKRVIIKLRSLAIPSVLVAGPATAGSFSEPYALVESGRTSAVRKEIPAVINAVDEHYTVDPRRSGPIKPGRRRFAIRFTTDVGPSSKHERTLEFDAEPCTRYLIVARYSNLTHVEWTPVIYPEPIGECLTAFRPNG